MRNLWLPRWGPPHCLDKLLGTHFRRYRVHDNHGICAAGALRSIAVVLVPYRCAKLHKGSVLPTGDKAT